MSRFVALLIAFFLAAGALVLSLLAGLVALVPLLLGLTALVLPLTIVAGEASYALVGYGFTKTGDGASLSPSWSLPDSRGWALVGLGTAGSVAFNRLVFAVGRHFGIDPVASVPTEGLTMALYLTLVPLLVLVVGPVEEYLFRGVLQSYLSESFSTWGAIGWTAVLFTVVHLPNALLAESVSFAGSTLALSVPVWFGLGVAFGWLYEASETLVVPALVHGFYNVAVFSLLFLDLGIL